MKKLIITASPGEDSFSHKIAEAYQKGSKQVGHEIEIIHLYDDQNSQPILQFTDTKQFENDPKRDIFQKKIGESEELIFIFPIWWGNIPGILKNFFDSNLQPGFAFKYSQNGPEKLLTGKTAKVFCTCDSPGFLYKYAFFSGINLKKYLKTMVFGFCGIQLSHFTLFEKMRTRDDTNKNNILKQVQDEARKL